MNQTTPHTRSPLPIAGRRLEPVLLYGPGPERPWRTRDHDATAQEVRTGRG
jgi:hypothetical protein